MERRQGKVIVHASGGTAGKGGNTYKLTLPSVWMRELGINENDREVELCFDGRSITIAKRLTMDEFLAERDDYIFCFFIFCGFVSFLRVKGVFK